MAPGRHLARPVRSGRTEAISRSAGLVPGSLWAFETGRRQRFMSDRRRPAFCLTSSDAPTSDTMPP